MVRAGLSLLLIALPASLFACGATEDPIDAAGRPIRWEAPRTHYTAASYPRAEHACWTPRRPLPLVVEILWRGAVGLRDHRPFPLAEEDDAARQEALDGFGLALADDLAGGAVPPVEIHADQSARWRDVRDVLDRMLATPHLPARIRWLVDHDRIEGRLHQAARTQAWTPAGDDRPVVRIAVRRASDAEAVEVELAAGAWSITTREARWEDPSWEATRGAWRAAAPAIRAALGDGDRVVLVAHDGDDAHVLWSHVVTVLDVLLGLDVRRVAVPALDVELHLEPPDDLGAPPPEAPDDPVFAPLVAFLATFMVLFALAITLIPAWFERSARKRPRGRGPS